MAGARLVDPDLEFIRAVKSAGGETLKNCYQCATCSTVCNLSPDDKPFPRKEMLMANWGQTEDLMRDPDVWLCYQCNDCTTYCPRGARPGDVLAAIRAFTYRHFSFPSFMGKALSNPRALPLLIIIPILIMTACIVFTAPKDADGSYVFMTSSEVDFNHFLPHSTVDALFVFGNIIIFIFAAVGFVRFWKMLQSNGDRKSVSFGSAFLSTVKEIFAHSRFRKCGTNHARSTGHMILLFGFIGAMITTAIVLLFVFIPHYLELLGAQSIRSFFHVPINFPHPVKILGALSGLALTAGGALLIYRRWTNKDEVGANGYADYLFLYVIFITGLSGMFSWLARLTGVAPLAYAIYFLHILGVYFLLWYMPYSKFAHMFYRSLALVHAHTTGRIKG